jgi:hypothetical protein
VLSDVKCTKCEQYQNYFIIRIFKNQIKIIIYATVIPGSLTDIGPLNFSANASNDTDPQFIDKVGFNLHISSSSSISAHHHRLRQIQNTPKCLRKIQFPLI